MVRVWLRPALLALCRQAAQNVALNGASKQALAAQQLLTVRGFASKKDKNSKKLLSAKFEDMDEDPTEMSPEVKYEMKQSRDKDWDPDFIKATLHLEDESDSDNELVEGESDGEGEDEDEIAQLERLLADADDDEDAFLEDGEEGLTDAEWAAKYERELARMDNVREVEDDRLYIEMPHRDSSLLMATDGDANDSGSDDDDEEDGDDLDDVADDRDSASKPFGQWEQGMAYSPEMMNWMNPKAGKPLLPYKNEKPWKYFVRANHPDVVELALDTELLRLFIAPTGRIRPRRFTGLTAKQQRQMARAIKISRQMALLPYLSRYPEPSPQEWAALEDDWIAEHPDDEDEDDDDDDDDDDDGEFAGMLDDDE